MNLKTVEYLDTENGQELCIKKERIPRPKNFPVELLRGMKDNYGNVNKKEEYGYDLEEALEKFNHSGSKVWIYFILLCIPGFFNVWHLTSYVFLGQSLEYFCNITVLENANWTSTEIKNISIPSFGYEAGCHIYDWNYTELAHMTYGEAMKTTIREEKPNVLKCEHWKYIGDSIVSEWDLVCSKTALRSTAQMFVSLGKFLGAIIFGFIADRWGRKKSFAIACILYIFAGPICGFSPYYTMFVIARFCLGLAGSGTYNVGFTLLTELCTPKHRSILGVLYNLSYPLGMMLLSLIAYYETSWRKLQLIISIPALILIVHCWILPESPRWLLSQNLNIQAKKVIKKICGVKLRISPSTTDMKICEENHDYPSNLASVDTPSKIHTPWYKETLNSLSTLGSLFSNKELRKRLLICYYSWMVTAMTYYGLTLSAENFTADRYMYVAITGLVEALSTIILVPVMSHLGRKCISVILYFCASAALISIIFIAREKVVFVLTVAMIGRLCISAVYAVLVLHTSELFPTVNRNFAVGTSSTMSHVGSLFAPYVVDLLGAQAWYIPSTICGIATLLAGFAISMLPETKDKKLCDTMEDVLKYKRNEKVSIRNCCNFK